MYRSRFPVLVLAAALTGCAAVGPDFQPPAPAAPPDWSAWHGGSPELSEPALRGASGSLAGGFNDPVLAGLLDTAMSANRDLKTAALRYAQSRVQQMAVAAQSSPQVNASAAALRLRDSETGNATRMVDALAPPNRDALIGVLSDPHNLFQAGFDASWELDLWGRVRRSIEAADASADAQAATLRQVRLGVATELTRHYVELRGTQRQLRLTEAELAAADETLQLLRSRAAGGQADQTDVTRQLAQLADLGARLPQLREQEARSINQITLLAGQRPGALGTELADHGSMPAALPDLSPGLPSELAARRPDIQAAQARLHAATASIGVATADLYPRITLGGSFGLESLHGGQFADWGSRRWSVGPSLSLPLFDGGRRRATVELRQLEQQEAAIAYQQVVLQAWHEVDSALSAYGAERLRQQRLAQKEEASRTALELAQARHAGGLSDLQPELDARRALLQAQRDCAQSGSALGTRLVAVYKALGAMPER